MFQTIESQLKLITEMNDGDGIKILLICLGPILKKRHG